MLSIIWLFSYLAILLYGSVALFCLGCGLLCITELIEEHIVMTGKVIRYMIITEWLLHLILLLSDNVTIFVIGSGLVAHVCYWYMLKQFPAFLYTSHSFIASVVACLVHHVAAMNMAHSAFHTPTEMMAYFTFVVWAVPFMFVVSLSANDLVLPQTAEFTSQQREQEPLLFTNQDVVSAYFKRKRRSLYSVLSAIRDSLPSLKSKKGF